MKKDLTIHFVFALAFFILFSIYRNWLSVSFFPFWFGALLGTLLPDVDYLLYVYVIKPNESVSRDAAALISEKKVIKTWDTLVGGFGDRKGLLIHNASFQALFLVFAVWIITSGNLMGMGLVLAFMLHLILDQVGDLLETGRFDKWFEGFPVNFDPEQRRWFLVGNVVVFLFFGFFF